MADRDLRAASRRLEENIPAADFGRIAERGHALRRRRRAAQGVAGVVAVGAVVAAVTVGVTYPWTAERQLPVAPQPDPAVTATATARQILGHPRAVVQDEATQVSDTGAVLQLVVVPSPAGGGCPADRRSALVWQDGTGGQVAWSDGVAGRRVAAVPGGFVVGAVLPECAERVNAGASASYVVDEDGDRTEVTWSEGAEAECAVDPAASLCSVDAATATGELLAEPVLSRTTPDAAHEPLATDGADVWARSADSREIAWSQDGGRSWDSHTTSLDPQRTSNVQVTAAGDWIVFYTYPEVEFSSDHGRSWQERDLQDALSPVLVAEEAVTVTPEGGLVGVSYPVGGPPVLFASTDDEWTRFVEADVRTAFGAIDVRTAGEWLWVPDQGRVWLSGDGGLSWTVADPLR